MPCARDHLISRTMAILFELQRTKALPGHRKHRSQMRRNRMCLRIISCRCGRVAQLGEHLLCKHELPFQSFDPLLAFLIFSTILGNLLLARSKPRDHSWVGFWYSWIWGLLGEPFSETKNLKHCRDDSLVEFHSSLEPKYNHTNDFPRIVVSE